MIGHLQITVLADNYVAAPNLLAEHGLCMLIEADGCRILFDTGQSRVAMHNADTLGIDLARLDAVVLSHGHYDHTGGLADLLQEHAPPAVFLHPAAAEPKYARGDRPPHRLIGMPKSSRQVLDAFQGRVVWTQSTTEVVPGVCCTGEIPRLQGNDQSTSGFFLDAECRTPDPLADDQALYIDTPKGVVVIAGCAHAGVVNTLDHVCSLTDRKEVHTLAGGFHLGRTSHEQMERTANAIGRRNCRVLSPCHCTGMGAHAYLRARFHSLVQDVGVGTRLVLGEP